ncbi:uncharacterized protein FOMMEDRAFT_140822 [Fomitiporia mediterranea MF3/22]|uniref:uncharacterized protein n=1 Tax=Fomitiporia mediterranea (strain MF3/22) TaxID=694068 RepID=UPI0004407681|nr:uncharacterized protein FOMMEDRAFT_140822 [Fomitiporia mediterranea MF3/22]EJD03071.1 hypothetical protein FOMMEDRAFT_140822 [Fomitiporia mediterranea MF3/22]
MAPVRHPVATSTRSGRCAQPRPPVSQTFVNAHPELCLAPRLGPVPLPPEPQKDRQHPAHISYPTAYIPPHMGRDGRGNGGASYGQSEFRGHVTTAPSVNPTPVHYQSAHAPVPVVRPPPPPYSTTGYHVATNAVPLSQAVPVPVPKPRYSTSPPTPTASPPRPAVSSWRKRTSADNAQHGAFPTT